MAADPLAAGSVFEQARRRLTSPGPSNGRNGSHPEPIGIRSSITERLTKKFGLGESPLKRKALYQLLEKLHQEHGDEVIRIISEAVAQAVGAREPARYFCRAVKAKIAAAGLSIHAADDVMW